MKKVFSFLVVSFALSSAWAGNAAVGSWSTYEGKATQQPGGVVQTFTLRYDVLGYDTVNGVEFQKRKQEIVIGDPSAAPQVTETTAEVSLVTLDQAGLTAFVSGACVSNGGTVEDITVKAGTFSTCKFSSTQPTGESETVWIGPVAGAFVKSTYSDSTGSQEVELTGFSF